MHEEGGIRAQPRAIPADARRGSCGWPDIFALRVGRDWPSGDYRVQLRAKALDELTAEHYFVVRPVNPGADARDVLVLATNTYQAYNGWGGKNLYGNDASFVDSPDQLAHRPEPGVVLAFDRPYSRCLVAAPVLTR